MCAILRMRAILGYRAKCTGRASHCESLGVGRSKLFQRQMNKSKTTCFETHCVKNNHPGPKHRHHNLNGFRILAPDWSTGGGSTGGRGSASMSEKPPFSNFSMSWSTLRLNCAGPYMSQSVRGKLTWCGDKNSVRVNK